MRAVLGRNDFDVGVIGCEVRDVVRIAVEDGYRELDVVMVF